MNQLVKVLEKLSPVSLSFKAPTFNGVGEVELFIEQFRGVAYSNQWSERDNLLHLCGCLEGTARVYGWSGSAREIFESLRPRRPPGQGAPVGVEEKSPRIRVRIIRRLVSLVHPSMPAEERNS